MFKNQFQLRSKKKESDSEYDENENQKIKDQNDDEDDQNRPPHTLTSEEIQKIKERKRNQNKTILHSACEHNSIKIIKELLTMCKDGIFDINGKDSFDEMAPLHYICQNGNERIKTNFQNSKQIFQLMAAFKNYIKNYSWVVLYLYARAWQKASLI